MCGSSPRTWGTPAGISSNIYFPVHPHGRGEHTCKCLIMLGMTGSSPRTWGTQLKKFSLDCSIRFIPTDVGNTYSRFCLRPALPVHPHGRGEHSVYILRLLSSPGSSPRTWGTLLIPADQLEPKRFIPTDVGNTTSPVVKLGAARFIPTDVGNTIQNNCQPSRKRFIPTDVGNTINTSDSIDRISVHPHGRGEHLIQSHSEHFMPGSSPRTWGTQLRPPAQQAIKRFIPTDVGNTFPHLAKLGSSPVHPHGRGEH